MSSTGSRSSGRRNVLVFRRSTLSRESDDDDINECIEELPSASSAGQDHPGNQTAYDVAKDAPLRNSASAAAAVASTSEDQHRTASTLGPPSSSNATNTDAESVKSINSLTKVNDAPNPEPDTEVGTGTRMETRPRSLTRGDIPTFISLESPPHPKHGSASSRNASRTAGKGGTVVSGKKTKAAGTSLHKNTTAPKKPRSAKPVFVNCDDRRLTFVVDKSGGLHEPLAGCTSSGKTRSRSGARRLEDVDVEDIMDETDDILQDVSGCSDAFATDDSDTLVPSSADCSTATLIPDRPFSSISTVLSNDRDTSVEYSVPAVAAAEAAAVNITSLIVTDMELTNINTSKSPPALFDSVLENAAHEMTSTSASNSYTEEQQKEKRAIDHSAAGSGSNQALAKDRNEDRPTRRAQSKTRKTAATSKQARSSVSSAAVDSAECDSNTANGPSVNSNQETVLSQQKQSLRAAQQRRTTTLLGSTEPKAGTDGEVEEAMPKKVAAYVTKPGKIIYSTAQRRSSSNESGAAAKSRSKSRSILPLQSRPRSKQPSTSANLPVDSPSSAFAFDGTPKEDMVCRPAAMLAARKKYISMDDSVMVSEPAERPPLVRQRSLSSNDAGSRKMLDDDPTVSPHGIMLVLHNGKRTKPRRARCKSVQYDIPTTMSTPPVSDIPTTVSTPPVSVMPRTVDVPLTPYPKAPEHPSSQSADGDVTIVPDSSVVPTTTDQPLQQPTTEQLPQPDPVSASDKDRTVVQDKAVKVVILLCNIFILHSVL